MTTCTYKTIRINEAGIGQIKAGLEKYHKHGVDPVDPRFSDRDKILAAWALEVENNFVNGSGAYFEIRSWDTWRGEPLEVNITEGGYDLVEEDVEVD